MIFKYILLDPQGAYVARTIMPCMLNIGTEFEYEHNGFKPPRKGAGEGHAPVKATFQVHRINKDPGSVIVHIYCYQIKSETWMIDHLHKSESVVFNKSLPV